MLKGRKFLSIFVLGMTSFLLLLSVSIPISFKTRAHVPFTLGKTMEQFTAVKQLNKWFLPFAEMDSSQFASEEFPATSIKGGKNEITILTAKPGSISLGFSDAGVERDYRFLVTRDPKKHNSCIVTMSLDNTIWKRMIDPDPIDEMVMHSLKNLEKFTSNTELFYGYPIYTSAITDSSFLYLTAVIDPFQKAKGTRLLFDSLFQYSRQNNISNTGKRIFSSQAMNNSELRIFTGIAINSKSKINPATGITIKKMSAGKKLLVADYKGKYKDITAVYKALEQYKRDYQLASMEIPFEEFLTPGNGYEPEDSVSVKVCYPIF
ncbi:hypothetical protein [Flavihumibacter fluvii]|uniref:hypothetical protein n=1 Tax=Flavihumibacter fluvii TaxID=2838157 RepID=UPI001BDDE604|nr:hypothetical protein [Flavihumibacter fluvii]ULQ52539.1 hypothetical protein KJS93_20835 [Flavihumibacter fluvii]